MPDEPVRHFSVEIRDPTRGHKLITLIEILSPSNKRTGPDRRSYEEKQREILESDVHLVEIDLLRSGRRVYPSKPLEETVGRLDPRPDYAVMVSRAWMRAGPMGGYLAYPWSIREALPRVGVPLKHELPLVALDLQAAFDQVYDGGPYRRGAVRYDVPPEPPLSGADVEWAASLLR